MTILIRRNTPKPGFIGINVNLVLAYVLMNCVIDLWIIFIFMKFVVVVVFVDFIVAVLNFLVHSGNVYCVSIRKVT